jgi:hypothetical protein
MIAWGAWDNSESHGEPSFPTWLVSRISFAGNIFIRSTDTESGAEPSEVAAITGFRANGRILLFGRPGLPQYPLC